MNLPVDLLRCPISGHALKSAPADLLGRLRDEQGSGVLRNRDGAFAAKFEGGLMTVDGMWFYPIRDGIPSLLAGEAVPLVIPG